MTSPAIYAAYRDRAPVLVVNRSVVSTKGRTVRAVGVGCAVRTLAPATNLPFMAVLNGRPLLRRNWGYELKRNDILVFQFVPEGGGDGAGGSNPLRAILTIALLVVINLYAPGLAGTALLETGAALGSYSTYLALTQAALLVAGTALINAIAPVPSGPGGAIGTATSPSPTYNIALQGNNARLDQPIEVPYGRNVIYPSFAAQPYTEYVDNNQFYYALLSVGQGFFELETIKIDDTVVDDFDDVEYILLNPGDTQTLVKTNIVNAPEIAGQDMQTNVHVGPATACGLGLKANAISVDIAWPKGLFFAETDGTLGAKSTTWNVQVRSINDFDDPISSWVTLATETYSAASSTPIRITYRYVLAAARYQVRVVRLDARDDNSRAAHDMVWEALRAELNVPGVTDTNTTKLALKIRASAQLSGLSQRRVNVVGTRQLPVWDPGTGWSATPQTTRSIAWVLADILRNTIYGEGRPDSRIDLNGLYALHQIWEARGDRFNGVFDTLTTISAALQQVARAGRAVPIQRAGVMTFVRDGFQELPVALFNNRNIVKNSLQLDYIMRTEDTADAVDVQFWNERLWSWDTARRVVVPGVTGDPENVAKLQLFGVTNEAHALREARAIAAETAYRRIAGQFTTELSGMIPSFGDTIVVAHDLPGWAYGGELVDWDGDTSTATLSEPVPFTDAVNHYIRFEDSKGGHHGPYRCVPGTSANIVVLEEVIDFVPVTNFTKDSTRYVFGPADNYGKIMKVTGVRPRNDTQVDISVVVDDARVYQYELYGDPGDGGTGSGTGVGRPCFITADGTVIYSLATAAQRDHGGWIANSFGTIGGDLPYVIQESV